MHSAPDPLVSIALCTYNGARYLREQMDSLLAQTHRNIEILAVDDCSADESFSILQEYEGRDPRVRAFRNKENLGFRKNFERAISLCKGEFIALSDQDDIWHEEKLSILLQSIGAHALVYCNSALIDEEGRPLDVAMSDVMTMLSTDDPAVFANANCVSGHAMLFRRSLIEHAFPTPSCFFHDWWISAVAANWGGIVYCDQRLVLYRNHRAAVTDVLRESNVLRVPGYKWIELRAFRERVEHLAAIPGRNQAFLRRLRDLWVAREVQWLSPALACFLYRHRKRIYALRWSRRPKPRHIFRYALGLRFKRLTNPFAYDPPRPSTTSNDARANGGPTAS